MCGVGWTAKFTKMKVGTADELLAPILNAAASIKKREDQLRRTTRDLHTPVAKCAVVGGGNLRTFIVNCNRFAISV